MPAKLGIGLPGIGRLGLSGGKTAGGGGGSGPAAGSVAWYDFSSTSYYTLSDADVTAAVDRSGSGNTLGVLAGMESPHIKTVNGMTGLDCDTPADPGLGIAEPVAGLTSTTQVHVFIVYQRDEGNYVAGWENLISYNNAAWGNGWRLFNGKTPSATLKADVDGYAAGELAPGTATDTGAAVYKILELKWTGGSTELKTRVDEGAYGTDSSAPASTNYTAAQLTLGNSMGGGYSAEGTIGEVIIYNEVLSDADRNQTRAYLADKWL